LLGTRPGWVWIGRARLGKGGVSKAYLVKYKAQLALTVPLNGASSGGNSSGTSCPDARTHTNRESDGTGRSQIMMSSKNFGRNCGARRRSRTLLGYLLSFLRPHVASLWVYKC
jgi:hypothetical protein